MLSHSSLTSCHSFFLQFHTLFCVRCNSLFSQFLFNVLSEFSSLVQLLILKSSVCQEVSLHKEQRSIKRRAHSSLRILSIKDIPKLITQLAVTHEDILPNSEREFSLRESLNTLLSEFLFQLFPIRRQEIKGKSMHPTLTSRILQMHFNFTFASFFLINFCFLHIEYFLRLSILQKTPFLQNKRLAFPVTAFVDNYPDSVACFVQGKVVCTCLEVLYRNLVEILLS